MKKYNIEGNIDFFAELYKSLDGEDTDLIDEHKCLITGLNLVDKFVTMSCGHKFNYIPLYNDLVNYKLKFNESERANNKLLYNEIRCPYCRKKQNELLPYYEELGLNKVNGVNYYDENILNYNKCAYKLVISPNFDETKPESETNKKYYICNSPYATKINLYNINNNEPITYNDNNCYCYKHKNLMIEHYKLAEKQKAKEIANLAKQKAKNELKILKELEKQKLKEEKQKLKEEKQKTKKIEKQKGQEEKQKCKKEKKGVKKIIISDKNIIIGPSLVYTF